METQWRERKTAREEESERDSETEAEGRRSVGGKYIWQKAAGAYRLETDLRHAAQDASTASDRIASPHGSTKVPRSHPMHTGLLELAGVCPPCGLDGLHVLLSSAHAAACSAAAQQRSSAAVCLGPQHHSNHPTPRASLVLCVLHIAHARSRAAPAIARSYPAPKLRHSHNSYTLLQPPTASYRLLPPCAPLLSNDFKRIPTATNLTSCLWPAGGPSASTRGGRAMGACTCQP